MAAKKKAAKSAGASETPPPRPVAKKPPAAPAAKPAAKAAKPAPVAAPPPAPKKEVASKAPAKEVAAKPAPAKVPAAKPPAPKKPAAPAAKPPAPARPLAKPVAKDAKLKPAAPPKPPAKPRPAAFDDVDEPDDDDLDAEEKEEEDEQEEEPEAKAGGEDEGAEDAAPAARGRAAPVEEAEEEAAPKPVVRRVVPPLPPRKPGVITVAFSPDADDAFMLYGLANGKIDTENRKYELIRGDIAGLNAEAQKGTYDVTAFSFGAWQQVVDRYLVVPCGGSFGDQVGPVLVSKTPVRSGEVDGLTVAVPGRTTTAALVLRMWLYPNRISLLEVPFQQVGLAVKAGKARAGLLIHEGQLTYKADGLTRVMDLGQWWGEKTEGLPLPLGGVAIRRDIPAEERAKVALDLKRSIAYGLGHREEALDYAMPFGRGLARALLDKYVSIYVNELTLDYGERGKQAVHTLFDEAVRFGLLKERTDLEFAS